MPQPFAALKSFLLRRLSPAGYLGLHFTIGATFLVLATWLFASLAEDVVSAERITLVDASVADWLHSHATPSMTRLMLTVSDLHGTLAIISYVVLLGIWFAKRKDGYWLSILLATVPSGMLLNVWMKHAFHRARPIFDQPLLTLSTYSFPSGHAEGATLLYGVLAAFLVSHLQPWRWRAVIVAVAVLMVALVGLSRMYLGVHYLSDVIAAAIEGAAWLSLCLTAAASWRKRRALMTDAGNVIVPRE